jgi:hypothetical protein
MKKRMWVVGGSIGVAVLLVFAMFPSIADAQTIQTSRSSVPNEVMKDFQNSLEKFKNFKARWLNNDWKPGGFLDIKLLKENIRDVTWFPGSLIFRLIMLLLIIFALY